MREFFSNLNLNSRFVLFTTLTLSIIFFGLATYIYQYQQENYQQRSDTEMFQHVDDLSKLVRMEYRYRQQQVSHAMRMLAYEFRQQGRLQEQRESIPMALTNQLTQNKLLLNLPRWELAGRQLQGSTALVDTLQKIVQADVSIFQKSSVGFVRITTTERTSDGKRMEGYYLPPESAIVQNIERGKSYTTRIKQFDNWYIAHFEPIYINEQVRGMLAISMPEKDLSYLRREFKETRYFNTGYPFLMTEEGEFIIHPSREGSRTPDLLFVEQAQQNKRGKYISSNRRHYIYYSYFEPYELFIAAQVDQSELIDQPLQALRRSLFVSFLLALLFAALGMTLLVRATILNHIQRIVQQLSQMAKGRRVEPLYIHQNDEIGSIAQSLNQLIEGLNRYSVFAQEIEKGNLQANFEPLSEDDILGRALLDMRQSLQEATQRKQKEEWLNEHLNHFNEVLRQQFDSLDSFAARLIAETVKELNALQGALFLLDDEQINSQEQKLNMVACYAYDRYKRLQKTIRPGEGLVGQAFKEGDTINLLEIPDDYLHFGSGLGEAEPRNILIVPLKTNDITIGVMELASLEPFSPEQITLANKVAESIAATFFTVQNTARTERLLREQQELTEQLRAQEEEMRQNLEELQATQEEMERNQKQLHSLLQESQRKEELLNTLINNTSDLIIAIDTDYRISIHNQPARHWFLENNGVHLNNGANLLTMLTIEQSEHFKEYLDRALLGEQFTAIETLKQQEDKQLQYWEYTFNPLKGKGDKPAGVSIFARNVTDRIIQNQDLEQSHQSMLAKNQQLQQQLEALTQTLQALRQEQNELETKEAAIDSSPIAKLEMSIDGKILAVNATFCQLFQYEKTELLQSNYNKLVDAETLNSIEYLNFWRNLRNGIAQHGQYKRITRYKEPLWLVATYTPIKNEAGKVEKILQMAMDITAFVLREEVYELRIARLQEELEHCRNSKKR